MRTVIQRVKYASVTIDGNLKSKIGKGLLILVGIEVSAFCVGMLLEYILQVKAL